MIKAFARRLREVPWEHVTVDDAFWAPRLKLLQEVTVPLVFSRFENDGAFGNFDAVRDGRRGSHAGAPWFDGLIYETICGASKLLAQGADTELDARLDGYIGKIAAAQAAGPDGYLNTYTTLLFPEKRWGGNGGNLRWQHDVYNSGCLVEAAVYHYRATGKRHLLDVAIRLADHMCAYMGRSPRKNIVPAHPLPEHAMIELSRLFHQRPELRGADPGTRGDSGTRAGSHTPADSRNRAKAYLALARFWIDNRGNHRARATTLPDLQEYAQDHLPLLRQKEAVGHAVRATLLYAGMAALGQESGRARYLRAARGLWSDVVTRKMHVTGGVGAMPEEEMFGPAFFLPNNAYLETCAAVGLAFWAHAMTIAHTDAAYADVFERALYNNVLAGVSLDGTRFFYQNPLESGGGHHRWEWHGCPCCPPMFLKLAGGIGGYAWAHDHRTIYVNHYVGSRTTVPMGGGTVSLRQVTRYPWAGRVEITLDLPRPSAFAVALRVPRWCRGHRISLNGALQPTAAPDASGYVRLRRTWRPGDTILLDLEMPVTLVEANPYVEADRGKVAIQRGPIVYCLEGTDNPRDLAGIMIPADPDLHAEAAPDLLGGVVVVKGTAADGSPLTAVPYFAWDNRPGGNAAPANPMRVWIRRKGDWDPVGNVWARPVDLASWEGRLYRVCWSSPGT